MIGNICLSMFCLGGHHHHHCITGCASTYSKYKHTIMVFISINMIIFSRMQENRMRKTSTAGLLRGSDSPDEKSEFEEKENVNQTKRKRGFYNLSKLKF